MGLIFLSVDKCGKKVEKKGPILINTYIWLRISQPQQVDVVQYLNLGDDQHM